MPSLPPRARGFGPCPCSGMVSAGRETPLAIGESLDWKDARLWPRLDRDHRTASVYPAFDFGVLKTVQTSLVLAASVRMTDVAISVAFNFAGPASSAPPGLPLYGHEPCPGLVSADPAS